MEDKDFLDRITSDRHSRPSPKSRAEQRRDSIRMFDRLSSLRAELTGDYEFITDEDRRKEIVEVSSALTRYVHDNHIRNVVLVDRAARPAWMGLSHFWEKYYPDEDKPNIYFVDPTGFLTGEDLLEEGYMGLPKIIYMLANDPRELSNIEDPQHLARDDNTVAQNFKDTYKQLVSECDSPTLIFDNCIHSGDTLTPVVRTFKEVGFEDLHLGVVSTTEDRSDVPMDFVAVNGEAAGGCYPFDHDFIVRKNFDSPTSQRNTDREDIDRSKRLRKELRRLFAEADSSWEVDSEEVLERVQRTKKQERRKEIKNNSLGTLSRLFAKLRGGNSGANKGMEKDISSLPGITLESLKELDLTGPEISRARRSQRGESLPIYEDQEPHVEDWSILSDEPPQNVLVFHTDGERYVFREGEELNIYYDGRGVETTEKRIRKLKEAVKESDSGEVKAFLVRNQDGLRVNSD